MTFTTEEREQIRRYLGYPANQQSIANVADRAAAVGALPGVATTVREYLSQLSALDTQRAEAVPLASQSFRSGGPAGGVEQYFKNQRVENLQAEQQRYARLLAETMNLQVYSDIFAPQPRAARTIRQ